MATFAPLTEPSAEVPELRGVDIDWNRIFGSALSAETDEYGRRGGSRLHDEIDEDADDGTTRGRGRS
jgi:hypothetical protein